MTLKPLGGADPVSGSCGFRFRSSFDTLPMVQPYLVVAEYGRKMHVSYFGPLLWFIGLPVASASNELYISLTLEDPETGQVLWTQYSRRGKSETSWIYALKPDFNSDKLLKGAMTLEFIPSFLVDMVLFFCVLDDLSNVRAVCGRGMSSGSNLHPDVLRNARRSF